MNHGGRYGLLGSATGLLRLGNRSSRSSNKRRSFVRPDSVLKAALAATLVALVVPNIQLAILQLTMWHTLP